MSYTTEATIYPTFVEFLIETVAEEALYSTAQTALQWANMDDSEQLEMPLVEYVTFALNNTDFASMMKDSLRMNHAEEGKAVVYAGNHTTVVVYNLPA